MNSEKIGQIFVEIRDQSLKRWIEFGICKAEFWRVLKTIRSHWALDSGFVGRRNEFSCKHGQEIQDGAVGPAEAQLDFVFPASSDPDRVGGVVLLVHVALGEEVEVAAVEELLCEAV